MDPSPDRTSDYKSDSLSLSGAIAMGTGVMIGAVFGFERIYLGRWTEMRGNGHAVHEDGGE